MNERNIYDRRYLIVCKQDISNDTITRTEFNLLLLFVLIALIAAALLGCYNVRLQRWVGLEEPVKCLVA